MPLTFEGLRGAVRLDRADVLTALVLALAAAACRALLTGIQTRWQLLVSYLILIAYEFGRRRQGSGRRGVASLALNGFAVTFAMLAVKFATEGRPHLHAVLSALHRLFG